MILKFRKLSFTIHIFKFSSSQPCTFLLLPFTRIEIQARTTARDLAKLIANSNAEEDSDLESESESEPEVKLSTTARKTANNLGRIVNDYSSSEDSQSETEREIEIQARELSRLVPSRFFLFSFLLTLTISLEHYPDHKLKIIRTRRETTKILLSFLK